MNCKILSLLVSLIILSTQSFAETAPAPKTSIPRESLTDEERRILNRGEISNSNHVVGGLVGTFLGFGLGHAVQGVYDERSAIKFTVGEGVSYAMIVIGAFSCHNDPGSYSRSVNDCSGAAGMVALGLIGYVGFRIWEIVDVWVGPPAHNRRYRSLKGETKPQQLSFFAVPTGKGEVLGGLQFRF